jgi:cystathionine gamma-synthase/methionine-gamma-lyase
VSGVEPAGGPDFSTLVVRAGQPADLGGARPTVPPIHNASAFYFDSAARLDRAFEGGGYVYSRFANPTVAAFETAVAQLEGAAGAVAFGSGLAALHAAILTCRTGADRALIASRDCYGGTAGLIEGPLRAVGVRGELIDFQDPVELERALAERPAALLVETLSNPLLRLVDLAELCARARAVGTRVIVDNTFGTPWLLRPLALGADLVVHSATKYLSGHGDVTAGVVAGAEPLLADLRTLARLVGGVLGPNEAWLALRGLRTLALRMERQCANALELAQWLESQPRADRVYYPGLDSHPQHDLARRLLRGGYGAVVAFDLRPATAAAATTFMDRLQLFTPAPTVGDLESLVMYPAQASHRSLSSDQRRQIGIGDGLIRLSVGIEAVADLRADLAQALGALD